jgi:hypothetical protein
LDRQQAMTLLKELTACDLIDPSWISIENLPNNDCKLKLKMASLSGTALDEYAAKNQLLLEKGDNYWLISKT